MRMSKVKYLYFKELLETTRNTKTLLLMIVIPLLLFPGLFIGIGYFSGKQLEKTEQSIYKVLLANDSDLSLRIQQNKSFKVVDKAVDNALLEKGHIDLIIDIPENFEKKVQNNIPVKIEILFDQANLGSIAAKEKISKILDEFQADIYSQKLLDNGMDANLLNLIDVSSRNVASSQKMGAFVFGRVLPFLMVILAFTGAMYTALSITVGEKERQTIETLIVCAIQRQEIVLGKFLTIFTTSIITAVLGLFSLYLTFQIGFASLSLDTAHQVSLSFLSIAIMFLSIFPVSAIFSAVLMTLGSISRSHKEGELYFNMFLMIVFAICIIAIIPGFEPTLKHYLIPIVNTTLIQKELLMSKFSLLYISSAIVSTILLAGASLYTAFKLFLREEILFRT
jgi:sodium transport system permease protein